MELDSEAFLIRYSYKGVSTLRIIGGIGLGLGLATTCIGILFRVQEWPGSGMNLINGLLVTFIVLIIAFIKYAKFKSDYYKPVFIRIAIVGDLGLILLILPEPAFRELQFRYHPDYIKAHEDYLKDPENDE